VSDKSTRYTFPRSARLLSKFQYQQVFRHAIKSADDCFTVLANPASEKNVRLGLAISKKMVARSVDRNRLKRLIRESFRLNRTKMRDLDLVVMARKGSHNQSNQVLSDSLLKHWKRIQKRCEKS